MGWLARFLGLDNLVPHVSVAEMDQRLLAAAQSDQVACDILNESRRKRGEPMIRCGEGLPSWEGQLAAMRRDPVWEDL